MNQRETLKLLEETAERLSIKVIYEDLMGEGGFCRTPECSYIIINSRLKLAKKIELLKSGLSHLHLDNLYIPPKVRQLLKEPPD